jgi:hypothetical protein
MSILFPSQASHGKLMAACSKHALAKPRSVIISVFPEMVSGSNRLLRLMDFNQQEF